MDNKVDFFQKKMSNPRSFSREKKTSKLWIWLFIALLLLILWLVSWKVFNNGGWNEIQDFNFSLWDEVFLQWEIKADGNIATYTHTIEDINYWKIWLKSDSINLSEYVWFVQLTWIVEKFYQDDPIVKVYSISWNKVEVGDEITLAFESDGSFYVPEAGVLFLPNFYNDYLFLNDWKNWNILIKKIDSWEEISIDYFRCNSANPSRNCKWLNESFENNKAQSFKTSEGDVYYKQSEDNSWFVSNWNWRWIFIHGASDDVIFELKDLIKFANEKNISEWVKIRATNICQWSWEKLQKVNSSEVLLKQEWLIVTVSGDWMEKQITCQILVDFSLPKKWQLLSLTVWDEVVLNETWDSEELETQTTWDVVEAPISATSLDTNVPQFPIKEEWLEYKSSRWWYSLQFPSSNISYSVSSVKENFGRNDINCSYVINVIKYSDKENLEVSPAIRVYECQWSVDKAWDKWIVVYSRLDKKFIVQLNDGAWNDFSMNLKFKALTEE